MIIISKKEWNDIYKDYKGIWQDYHNNHPEWIGKKTVMSTCITHNPNELCKLLIEDVDFVIEEYSEKTDKELEKLWEEFEDVTCIEAKDFYKDDEDYKDDISLVIMSGWQDFEAGTAIETIWHWFNQYHSKGVSWLINGCESAVPDTKVEEFLKNI